MKTPYFYCFIFHQLQAPITGQSLKLLKPISIMVSSGFQLDLFHIVIDMFFKS